MVLLALMGAVNPARVRLQVESSSGPGVAIGAAATFLLTAVVVIGADSILGFLDVTDETWRMAAGIVALIAGIHALATEPVTLPASAGRWAWAVPVTWPVLFTPQLLVLAVAFGATQSPGIVLAGCASALGAVAVVAPVSVRRRSGWIGGARWLGAVLVVAAVALIVTGIRDV